MKIVTTENNNPQSFDEVILEMRETFFCAMISDVLDGLGHTKQALAPCMRPLDDALVMVGRARTMLYADVYARPGPNENHYALEIGLVDDLRPGDIVVAASGEQIKNSLHYTSPLVFLERHLKRSSTIPPFHALKKDGTPH